ncbi:ribonuclease III [Hydrogenophaga sp. 2FB]|uniref:ribonuclease III n=1 Tax=Hydrogenophaga sp. 2FB TaxID=2502187 RepID=UPI0010F74F83|nr:ribonuclease III [Hydrogenophaga sp. 2FB]
MSPELLALQKRLQHTFANPRLLERALTHRSFSADHNERLEFLGDSVLSLAVSGLLFEKLSQLPEGDLSRVRANLVKQDTLFQIASGLGLATGLRLGDGEKRSGGHKRPSILADALEALIGAVYLDAGFEVAAALVHRMYSNIELNAQMSAMGKDPKTELQEWLQARKMKLPVYRVVATLGEAHKQTFDVECTVTETGHSERGIGASRRAGEQAAAAAMFQHLTAASAPSRNASSTDQQPR